MALASFAFNTIIGLSALAVDVSSGIAPSYDYGTVIHPKQLEEVGDAMTATANAAIPVGIGVMCITLGVPMAKKIIKKLGS